MLRTTGEYKKQKFSIEMNDVTFESVQCVKDLGVITASTLKLSEKYKGGAGKANMMLDFLKRNFSYKNKDMIMSL